MHNKIKNAVILTVALILVYFSILIEDRGLAILIGRDGMPIYPISSGSDDGAILKAGLFLFVISATFALASFVIRGGSRLSNWAYWFNNVFFAFCLFLVSLDSSLTWSADLGDWLPLAAVIIWLSGLFTYAIITLLFREKNA